MQLLYTFKGLDWLVGQPKSAHTSNYYLASFPGSPLPSMKNKNGGRKPGINSHVILQHDDITAIITKVVMQLCRHVIG